MDLSATFKRNIIMFLQLQNVNIYVYSIS